MTAYVFAAKVGFKSQMIARYESNAAAQSALAALSNDYFGWVFTEDQMPPTMDFTGASIVAAFNAIRVPETPEVKRFASVSDGIRRVFNRIKEIAVEQHPHEHTEEHDKYGAVAAQDETGGETGPAETSGTGDGTETPESEPQAPKELTKKEKRALDVAKRKQARVDAKKERDELKAKKADERKSAADAKKAEAEAEKAKRAEARKAAAASAEGREKGYAGMRGLPLSETQQKILKLLERKHGATLEEVVKGTGLSLKSAGNNVHRVNAKILPSRTVKLMKDGDRKFYKVVDPTPEPAPETEVEGATETTSETPVTE